MKRSKKPRVSWPPGPKLCQVKMFGTEECPAKVASQPQRHNYRKQSSGKVKTRAQPDLPPGFEGHHYLDKPNVINIPRIKWKRPPKFVVNPTWLVGSGGESTETKNENLRIAKELEAIYPHRSAIPSRPSVSPVVEAERFDDSKTPVIRLTPIEDEWEESSSSSSSSHTSLETNKLETKPPGSTQEPVSNLPPDLSLAASAALTVLMKTKEQGSMVDPDLLIKFLSDPKMVKNLITDPTGNSSVTKNQPVETNNPTRHVTTSSIAKKPQPIIIPQEQSFAASQPFTNPELRRVSPPKPGNGSIPNPLIIPNPVQSCVGMAKRPSLSTQLPASSLPMNLNLHRPQHAFSEPKITVKPQPQLLPNHRPPQHVSFRNCEMNNVQASIGFGRGPPQPQPRFDSYRMNLNRDNGPKPVMQQPMKSVDYFKNLIREHGTDSHETNQYHSRTGIFNGRVDNTKQCMCFGSPRGCPLGERCIYVHDRFRPNFEDETPRVAKRFKFGRYENYGL